MIEKSYEDLETNALHRDRNAVAPVGRTRTGTEGLHPREGTSAGCRDRDRPTHARQNHLIHLGTSAGQGRLEEPVTTRTEELLLARFDETLVRDEPAVARPSTRPV